MDSQSSSIRKEAIVSVSQQDLAAQNDHLDVHDYIAETRPWYKVPHLRLLSFSVFIITLASTNHGYDGSMLNGLQSLTSWQEAMGYPTGYRLGGLTNAMLFGYIAALPVCPYLADKFGRRPIILLGAALISIGAVLQGLATGYVFFLCSRLLLGMGGMAGTIGCPALISEIAYPTHREVSTFLYNVCWYLGAIIASWLTYGTRDISGKASWSIPSYMQALFPVIQLVFIWTIPESPRWYISKGKTDKARKVLTKYHIGNSTDPRHVALIDFEMKEIEIALEQERLFSATSSYMDFINKKNFRKRGLLCVIVGVMMQLSGNGLVSYYLTKVLISIGITETKKQLEINGCLMIYNFVVCVTMAGLCRYFKRRTMFLACLGGMCFCYIIWTVCSALNQQRNFEDTGLANAVLAMIFFYYACYDIGLNGLPYLYITEIMPYSHRAKGINIMSLSGYVALVYNGYVNPIAMDAISWKYYIVFCCILAVEVVIAFFLFPETSGYTLEEVAQVFGDAPPDFNNRNLETGTGTEKQSFEHAERV